MNGSNNKLVILARLKNFQLTFKEFMESSENYNFSIFSPRNHHGKKNRNVILSMLLIWAVAVFGFQFLLKAIQKPTPEKTLIMFESTWPSVISDDLNSIDYKTFLTSLVLVKGKNIVKPDDQRVLSEAISCVAFRIVPDSIKTMITEGIAELKSLKEQITTSTDQEYLDVKMMIRDKYKMLADITSPYTSFNYGSLEATIFTGSLVEKYPESFSDNAYVRLPDIMKLYLTHYQSILTDTKFLGFPFHYFYTAVFLLILFISLCIAYNILIERRLKIDGVAD